MRYLLQLEYLGSDFEGWQSQPSGRTIQDNLNKQLSIFLHEPIRTVAASRTDSGVHALDQICIFEYDKDIEPVRFMRAMRAMLPPSISIKKIEVVSDEFHPIAASVGKAYRYYIWNNPDWMSPFIKERVWHVYPKLDVEKMRQASRHLIGRHDFTSFAAVDGSAKSKIREIHTIDISQRDDLIEFLFIGGGFLKQMVRNIVGTLAQVGEGKISPDALPAILAAKDRRVAGPTAAAQGLVLAKVFFELPLDVATLQQSKMRAPTLDIL